MAFLAEWLPLAPILLFVGAIAGTLAGLLGVGGGIVIVPVLYLLAGPLGLSGDVAIHAAVATSLATIIPTSISSTRAHNKKGSVDFDLIKSWGPFVVLGAGFGGWLATRLDPSALAGVFGGVALLVALNMLRKTTWTLASAPPMALPGNAFVASPIGMLSAMMGIGGGTLSVPTLKMLSFPIHRAVGTAALFGLLIALPGVLGYALAGQITGMPPGSLGYISLPAAFLISLATFIAAPLGAKLAHRLSADHLRLAFALFLGLSASRMIWGALTG